MAFAIVYAIGANHPDLITAIGIPRKRNLSMSDTTNDATKLTARVIIELSAEGALSMEYYTNGQRTRTTLDRGNEWWQVVDQLHIQCKAITSANERRELQANE